MGKRIALVDDHQMFLDGAVSLLQLKSDGHCVSAFNDPEVFLLELADGAVFDLIVADLLMGKMNGLALVSAVRSRNLKMPILLLSGVEDALPGVNIERSGANGFISKKDGKDTFLQAVRTVLNGGTFFSPSNWAGSLEMSDGDTVNNLAGRRQIDCDKTPSLSDRQKEVLILVAGGNSNKEISRALEISENTVKSHLKQIFEEFGVSKRSACIRQAQLFGLI
ncbi:response regulator transcription factor [Roseibium sp.]|uniref:response regulator transcription factor n=1 Tax=Roseibium sp. TaxID=1936156 RepID=UPI003A96D9AD